MAFAKPKASSTQRGYDHAHRKERARRAKLHQPTDPCARCRRPLGPMGSWLHLDHDEHGGYLGFSHGLRCNISAGSSKGAHITNARRKAARALSRPLTLTRSDW